MVLEDAEPVPPYVDSLHESREYEVCGACTNLVQELRRYAGDAICERCVALFTAAHALFDNDVTDEAEIIGTLAFVYYAPNPSLEVADNYSSRLEVVRVVDGVQVLRLKKAVVTLTTYERSDIAKAVNVVVLSRHAEPHEVSALYEQTLLEHDIHYDKCGGGSITWSTQHACLTITIKPEKELHPARVQYFQAYPRGRIYSFAPPTLVREVCRSLLGSVDPRAFWGFAYALGDHGRSTRMSAEKTILGCVAWLLGERQDSSQAPKMRRPRIARVLNNHLLKPLDKTPLPENGWTPEDTIWRDAAKVSKRLMRAGYFIQLSDSGAFKQHFE